MTGYGRLSSLSLFVGFLLSSWSLNAQPIQKPPCMERDKFTTVLRYNFKEVLQSQMVSKDGMLMSIYASPKGTYTMTFTSPGGLVCMLQTGDGYTIIPNT